MKAWPYLALLALLILSGFFSGSEIAYASVSRNRMKRHAESTRRRSRVAARIYEHYDSALSAILIGNNLVNIAASALSTVLALQLLEPWLGQSLSAVVSTALITVLILIFGEVTPKVLAKRRNESFALAVAYPLQALIYVFTPIVWLTNASLKLVRRFWKHTDPDDTVTEGELVTLIETVEDEGVIDEERSELLQSAIEFNDISAQEVLTPRVDMVALDIEDDWDTILHTAMQSPYSRLPVYKHSPDRILGIVVLNHLFDAIVAQAAPVDLRTLLLPACFIHKSMKLPAVLAELKRRKTHIAIVTDEYGGTMGVLTMEDVLEQLVGDIWDESDQIVHEFTPLGNDTYAVRGDMNLADLFEELELELPEEEENEPITVGGWAIAHLQGYPHVGDSFQEDRLQVTLSETDELRVTGVQIRLLPIAEQED